MGTIDSTQGIGPASVSAEDLTRSSVPPGMEQSIHALLGSDAFAEVRRQLAEIRRHRPLLQDGHLIYTTGGACDQGSEVAIIL